MYRFLPSFSDHHGRSGQVTEKPETPSVMTDRIRRGSASAAAQIITLDRQILMGRMVNLSAEGACLELQEPALVEAGQRVMFKSILLDMRTIAVVAWNTQTMLGLEYLGTEKRRLVRRSHLHPKTLTRAQLR